jgi:hypothetical protein
MRSLGGFVLLAGIGVGLFVYFPAPVDRSTSLEQATRATELRAAEHAAAPVAIVPSTPTSRVASFAPPTTLKTHLHPNRLAVAVPARPTAAAPAAKVEAIANWQTTVAPSGSGALEPTDPEARYKLVVDIQQHLKRVGCYWGRANGSWTSSTREAMREFTSHANAALPVEKPDYLLLSLLKGYSGRSCGASDSTVATTAPAAEVLPWKAASADQKSAIRLFTPVPTSVVSTEPLPGRMAIGAPLPPSNQGPLVPGTSPASHGTATAALDPGVTSPGAPAGPAYAAPKPRSSKKASNWRKPAAGTPRYNLMLSLGGVY